MIAVGIDVSKSKSTVAILDSYGTVLATPFNMAHTQPEMNALVSRLKELGEPVTILLEYTGHKIFKPAIWWVNFLRPFLETAAQKLDLTNIS